MSLLLSSAKKSLHSYISIVSIQLMMPVFFVLFGGCAQKKDAVSYPSPPGYDLTNPVVVHLRTHLDEISGITYYPKDSSIFAIDDEDGVLHKIYIRKQVQVKQWKFSSQGDYEDIVLHDSTFYALLSNGNIKTFTFLSKDSIKSADYTIPLQENNEFETLYFDSKFKKLILICKDCETDNRESTSAYAFDPVNQTFSDTPFFTINADDVADELGVDKLKFKPSAAAVHPLTKHLYIISAENKALVVANHYGKVKDVYELDPGLFKQPEGITFTSAGDLLISNESADAGAPNILIFKYKPLLHEKS